MLINKMVKNKTSKIVVNQSHPANPNSWNVQNPFASVGIHASGVTMGATPLSAGIVAEESVKKKTEKRYRSIDDPWEV